jgi:hypothetical protein
MKPQIVGAIFITSSLSLSLSPVAKAQNSTFYCGTWNGVPATLARTAKGESVPVIRWVSDHFSDSGYTPQTRCEMVSARFQDYNQQGILKFITTGTMNRMPVVCVAEQEGGNCAGLLFTLKKGTNPNQTLRNLLAVRYQARGPLNETNQRIYINMDEYLNNSSSIAPESNSSEVIAPPSPQVEPSPSPSPSASPTSNGGVW